MPTSGAPKYVAGDWLELGEDAKPFSGVQLKRGEILIANAASEIAYEKGFRDGCASVTIEAEAVDE